MARFRILCVLLAFVVAASSCAVGAPADDPSLLDLLDVRAPETIDWRRSVGTIEVAGSGVEADPDELQLIDRALTEIPETLLERGGPGHIYRLRTGNGAVEEGTLAFTRGTDIYLIDLTFDRTLTTLDMAAVLAHEMVHVAQFRALTEADVERVIDDVDPDPIGASGFVAEFAEAVGWRLNESGSWQLADPSGTTEYGATEPDEDMAEAVARVALGDAGPIDEARIRWVEEWLGVGAARLAEGKPFIPAGAERIDSQQPIYDEAEVARFGATVVEPMYYLLPADVPGSASLVREIESRLATRRLAGSLERVDDTRVERHAGLFLRGDGVRYWVEVWDFRRATGFVDPPPGPVVTYVVLR